jgi:alpha-beta hydrolase superfamily lysophospholipase
MKAWLRGVVAAALVTVPALSGLSSLAAAAASTAAPSAQCAPGMRVGPAGDAFYNPPTPLPKGAHGNVIWARRVEAPDHAVACKVLYLSTLHDGTPVATSGLVVWPTGPVPPGGRNVVAWAHGTVGGPRQCAPSAAPDPARNLVDYFTYQSPFQIDVGVPALTTFLAAGDVVVATDYQGLGTPGVHQYVVAGTETHNVLDSVDAARRIQPVHASNRLAVLGWSQGGGAALFIGQDIHAYSPDLKLVGVAALAPAADLGPQFAGKVLPGPRDASSPAHNAALRVNVYRGFLAAYPELHATDVLQPNGLEALQGDGVACIEHFADVVQSNVADVHQLNTLFKPLREVPSTWQKRFQENTPGYATTVAPVLVMQGTADTVINPHSTEQYIKRACAFSQPVQYTTYQGATHNTVPFEAQQQYTSWIAARFAGTAAPSTCC